MDRVSLIHVCATDRHTDRQPEGERVLCRTSAQLSDNRHEGSGQGRAGQGRDGRSPIAIEAMSRLCTLCGCDIAPRLMRRSRARVRDSWGGAVGNGKFSTSEMPRDLI
jgi:hypothetical protein